MKRKAYSGTRGIMTTGTTTATYESHGHLKKLNY